MTKYVSRRVDRDYILPDSSRYRQLTLREDAITLTVVWQLTHRIYLGICDTILIAIKWLLIKTKRARLAKTELDN